MTSIWGWSSQARGSSSSRSGGKSQRSKVRCLLYLCSISYAPHRQFRSGYSKRINRPGFPLIRQLQFLLVRCPSDDIDPLHLSQPDHTQHTAPAVHLERFFTSFVAQLNPSFTGSRS